VGLPPDCQKAYAAMRACLEKTIAANPQYAE
jgi:phage tail protein X